MEDLNLKKNLINFINLKKTILGVGPMSMNCINAANYISNKHKIPMFLICSRRQIDSSDFGGGYVNNWDTASYSKYIKKRDKKNNLILCRDHGGPWQNNLELKKKLNLVQAMKSAKQSYLEDIKNNFEIIHIDASLNLRNNDKINDAL